MDQKAQSRRVETMKVGGGADYAKVATRLHEFHGDNEACSIETTVEFKEGWILAAAKVTSKRGIYTGHSLGQAKGIKALEKIETIAVGRALAFAGYSSKGDIASFEEMQDYGEASRLGSSGVGSQGNPVLSVLYEKIQAAKTPEELSDVRRRINAMVIDETVDAATGLQLSTMLNRRAAILEIGNPY